MKIDWSQHSAEEIIEAHKDAPYAMSAWDRSDFSEMYSRMSVVFPSGRHKHACVQRACLRGVPASESPWTYSLGYGPGDYKGDFATADEAMKAADEEMRRRGWKLVGDPSPPKRLPCGCGCSACQDFEMDEP